jgi:hypothetical protein
MARMRTMRSAHLALLLPLLSVAVACGSPSGDGGAATGDDEAITRADPAFVAAVKQRVDAIENLGPDVNPSSLSAAVLRRYQHIEKVAVRDGDHLAGVGQLTLPAFPAKTAYVVFWGAVDHNLAIYDEAGRFVAAGGDTERDPFSWWSRAP